MKTKFILTHFAGVFGTLRFEDKTFSNTLLRFTPYWDYTPTNAIHVDSPSLYISDKN